ncbi:MAG: efflux RND transporter permease subunit, partial [Planctomycetota bacterium]|nr:efflux RND transporter permease subunit [Planctomycetota bacterium]
MQQKGDRGLFSLFVDRPIFTLMVTLALLLVGAISFAKLPLRFVPEGLSQNEIRIWIPLGQDMSPREVEEKVAKPLEEQLRTIPGIQRIRSDSGNGRAFVSAQLDTGMNPDLATAEVRDRIQRARLEWPPGTDRYFTWKEDASSVPLAFFQMLTPERSSDWDYLLDQVLRPRLEAVDGVGRVDIFGLFDETVRIWFNIDKLTAHRVDYRRLIERLSSDNFTEPLGEIDDGQK